MPLSLVVVSLLTVGPHANTFNFACWGKVKKGGRGRSVVHEIIQHGKG